MPNIHRASSENINYKYHEPKPNNKGNIKGLMYQKVDKNTGEMKLKSGSGVFERLMLKAQGYTKMTESTARKFLESKFTNAALPHDFNIATDIKSSSSKRNTVVRADVFQSTFKKQMGKDQLVADLKAELYPNS